ncbi:MAG: beta-lactamase family protein [Saprospiraceae bacterium]|nr:beta-lactamase family protein [Saprospiraceae bacterium]MCF8250128.1 beta-lactamase family protein [Saprospiraceae bacterium]MCF8279392.1 beta-lactamase family protein [Bacteroidales bacterium]MCF8311182.1 beta-lactamase family protein [Saprospiraceae bacterium]MCF8440437.1 beta-lactamase family protein [Saprospiraceae bacterium]
MIYTRLIIPFILGLTMFAACTHSDPPSKPMGAFLRPSPPPLDPNLEVFLKDYHRYFEDSMILTLTPGAAVVIVKDSQVVFIKGYGYRAEGRPERVDEHTVFRIGSLSKGFAGILTGMLVEEGNLKWTDKVQQYLPDFNMRDPEQAQRLEVRHLLTQTTGLPYHSFSNLIERGYDSSYVLSQYPLAKLAGKEGDYFSYQNAAFSLIEPILGQATGKPFNQLLEEKIFHPLGMGNASSDYEGIVNSPNHALPHHYRRPGWAADSITHRYYKFAAAGGVNASVSDMGEWLKALLGHQPTVIPAKVLKDAFTPVIGTGLERPTLQGFIDRDSAFYAKGWRILEHGSDTLVYHAGFVNNFLCEIALNQRDGIGICVLFNAPSPLAGKCIPAFFRRWEKVRGKMGKVQS